MPLDENIPGFSNRWYKPAMDSAVVNELEQLGALATGGNPVDM